jgi:hypothetical protein
MGVVFAGPTSQAALDRSISEVVGVSGVEPMWERIEPWSVFRVRIGDVSVIVKRLRDDPAGFRVDPRQLTTEIAALRFVEAIGLDVAPRVLASDEELGVVVLEDLHPRVPLPDVLIAGDATAGTDGLMEFFHALGSLGAATAGRESAFDAPTVPSPEDLELAGWRDTLRFADAFGVLPTAGVTRDIAAMFDELADPGGFLAMSNGDPGTNNFLVAPGLDGKLIDFEFARFRHALLDAVHIHVQSPQWITLPDPRPLEDAYRRALASGVPEAEDDLWFDRGLTAACLSYALVRLRRLEKLTPRRPGELSRLQLVATLESADRLSRERGWLRDLGGWCSSVAAALRRAWPDTDVDLTELPPFLARDERSARIIDTTREVSHGT